MRCINKFSSLALVSLAGGVASAHATGNLKRTTTPALSPLIQTLSSEQLLKLKKQHTPYFKLQLLPGRTGYLRLPDDALKVYLANNRVASLEVRDKHILAIQAKAVGEAYVAVFVKQTSSDVVGKLMLCQVVAQPPASYEVRDDSKLKGDFNDWGHFDFDGQTLYLVSVKHQPDR